MPMRYFFSAHHTTYNVSWESHLHDHFEFNLVLSDGVQIETEHGSYNASYGDLFVFEPFLFHKINAENIEYERCILGFYEEDLLNAAECLRDAFEDVKKIKVINLKEHKEELSRIIEIFDKAVPYYDKEMPMKDFEIVACVGEILRIVSTLPKSDGAGQSRSQSKITQILKYVKDNACENISINDICAKFSLSPSALHKMFKDHINMSPGEYILRTKLNIAIIWLARGKSVTETANLAGFNSYSHFIRIFKSRVGVPPHKYAELRKSAGKY